MLIRVTLENVDREIRDSEKAVLLAYLHQDAEDSPQFAILKNISESWRASVTVCMLFARLPESIGGKYGLKGTPTFLFFKEGKIYGQLLGQADRNELVEFLKAGLRPGHHRSKAIDTNIGAFHS